MSYNSYSASPSSRRNIQTKQWEPEFGAITGLPIIPCPRCGDRVLELVSRKNDGEVFFKCVQNDQDVPMEYRNCGFYKQAKEYEPVVVGWARRHGINLGQYGIVAQSRNMPTQLANMVPQASQSADGNAPKKEAKCNEDGKMDKLIKLAEWILLTNLVVAVVVSLAVLVMLVK